MRILFLGYAVSIDEANKLSGGSVAGNNMQLELLRELSRTPTVELDVCSILPVATFPTERRKWIRASQSEITPGVHAARPGFVTLPVLKQISQIMSAAMTVSRLSLRQKYDYVLTFNMHPVIGVAAWWLKKWRGVTIACVLADPPVATREGSNFIVSGALRAYDLWTRHLLTKVDRVISLTREGAKQFTPQAQAIVIDGAVPQSLLSPIADRELRHEEKKIVFTGALTAYNGVIELVQAMDQVSDPNAILHIYGKGPLSEFVESSARVSERIVFHGKVDSSEIAALQREAFLLVNPRQIDHPVSSVTFPSKLLEYMASGVPVLTTRLSSISSEYDGFMYFADIGSAEDLAAHIDALCALPPEITALVGAAARRFVLETRTWRTATERLVRFLSEPEPVASD